MWQLIGSAVAGLMILLTMPVYNDIQANNLAATVDADAASQFQTILAGAQKYAAAQKDTLTDTLSIGGAYQEVPFADLVNTDTVPGGFSQTNVLGATWHVYVQQPASGAIRTMVTATGGRTLTQSDLINIAGLTGDQGGYVPMTACSATSPLPKPMARHGTSRFPGCRHQELGICLAPSL
ncbi:hypothetical protein [Acetobacter papayae]|uniref:hypothetical protein n=1 Tax=Acetobacter papayae TaxID=1076592 RepID=UPI000470E411|nr:hypothetical protein [Acetobacter papayae]